MHLKRLELNGFKSFAKKSEFVFDVPIIAIVGPNGSGKSNVVESIRFVLGEQSVKSMRGKTGSDLIFKGSKDVSKMSRAAVTIVFDNTDRVFHIHNNDTAKINVDFDEVSITRTVFADGINTYAINGHEVRMKDIHELIGSVNIGASGHHIISQGEADRYLNANIKDRRELIEEALGLKIYQYRLKESIRKLEKSEINMRESEMLRRELAPHLRFLKRQVDKIEQSKELRMNLGLQYKDYFSKEDYLIQRLQKDIGGTQLHLDEKMNLVKEFFQSHGDREQSRIYPEESHITEKQIHITHWQEKISHNTREIGKIEGMISVLTKQEKESKQKSDEKTHHPGFSFAQVQDLVHRILQKIHIIPTSNIAHILDEVKKDLHAFIETKGHQSSEVIDNSTEIKELERKKQIFLDATQEAQGYIKDFENDIQVLSATILEQQRIERESQKKYYEYVALQKEIEGKQALLTTRTTSLQERIHARNEEYTEACVLLSEENIHYQQTMIDESIEVTELTQEQKRREIERIKIRLEDMGGGSGIDTIKEFEETNERDNFLAKEILDIQSTITSLQAIINNLKETLNTEFDAGVEKINIQFNRFFGLMFGGGSAKLESAMVQNRRMKRDGDQLELLPSEDDISTEKEYGIDIKVQLPRKKVSDLAMLSGGERSLTSIALLFALSQVNPPPFLVLDETDAALDEANSQKYGDMIESLSEYSQLIVVTHNRETMSRAQTLFGVTLGREDYSTLLSLRLEDAAQYAK